MIAILAAPLLLWSLSIPKATPLEVRVDQGRPYLYAALKEGGIAVYRLSASGVPTKVATVSIEEFQGLHAMNLRLDGENAFVALGDHFAATGSKYGLARIDLKDPEHPKTADLWVSTAKGHGATDVAFGPNGQIWLGAMDAGIAELAVGDDGRLKQARLIRPDPNFPRKNPGKLGVPNVRGLFQSGDRLYVAYDAGGLRILDLEGRELGRYVNREMHGKQQAYNHVVVSGSLAYCAVDYAGLEILNVSDPSAIRQVGWWNPWRADRATNNWFNSSGHANDLALSADAKTAYLSAGDSELQVVDVSDPAHPRPQWGYGHKKDGLGAWGLEVADGVAYATYIRALVPFRGTWSGIKAFRLRYERSDR